MTYYPLFYSVFLLPLAAPAAALVLLLALSAGRQRRTTPGLLLALVVLLPTFLLAQCLLSAAGWCVNPINPAVPGPLYVPWYAELLLTPVCYLYLQVLGNPALQQPKAWGQLLPGIGQISLFAGVAVLGLGYRHGSVAVSFGPAGPAAELLGRVVTPLALACYISLLLYGFKTMDDYRRYHRYLAANFSDAERRRFINQRSLVMLLMVGFGLGLSFVALDAWFGPFDYPEIWYAFVVRGWLVFGLAVAGLQASYAATAQGQRLRWADTYNKTRPHGLPATADRSPETFLLLLPPEAGRPAATDGVAPELEPLRGQLLAYMKAQQPWLEPELTLAELAKRLGTGPGLLSRVINTGCGQNFNDFVNGYRVAEARRKLADPRFAHYSLVGVAMESGFNSKSTFNRVFKKLAGHPPSEVVRPKS